MYLVQTRRGSSKISFYLSFWMSCSNCKKSVADHESQAYTRVCTVADLGFPRRVVPTPEFRRWLIIWPDFPRKLHENERNYTKRDLTSLPPPGSINDVCISLLGNGHSGHCLLHFCCFYTLKLQVYHYNYNQKYLSFKIRGWLLKQCSSGNVCALVLGKELR